MIKLNSLLLENDNFVSIGFGRYKQKGKEKDPNAPTFKKDDAGKFVQTKSDKGSKGSEPKKTAPKVNIFDKPAAEPKSDGMATVNAIAAGTGVRAQAIAGWADENGVNLSKVAADLKSKKLKPMDMMTAVVGKPGNKYAKDIIAKYSQQSEPTPTETPKVQPRKVGKSLETKVNKISTKFGLDPQKLGKEEYEKRMLSLVHDTLEDANFHGANRAIFADLMGNPKLAKKPDYSKAPKFGSPKRDAWMEKNTIYGSGFKNMTSEFDGVNDAATDITSATGWDGQQSLDGILNKMRKDGSSELADKIQVAFDKTQNESVSSRLSTLLPESKKF
jgi:hypothetical protein